MSECDKILRAGIFNTLIVNSQKTISDNLFSWLSTVEWETFSKMQQDGLQVGFPIKGVPVNISGNHNKESFKEWKKAVQEGNVRNFDQSETFQLIKNNVDDTIVNAWLECIRSKSGQTGLTFETKSEENSKTLVIEVKYSPANINDVPPEISNWQLVGASFVIEPQITEVPYGGYTFVLTRDGDQEVTVILNLKGGGTKTHRVNRIQPPVTFQNIEGNYFYPGTTDDPKDDMYFRVVQKQADLTVEIKSASQKLYDTGEEGVAGMAAAIYNLELKQWVKETKEKIGGDRIETEEKKVYVKNTYIGKIEGGVAVLKSDPDNTFTMTITTNPYYDRLDILITSTEKSTNFPSCIKTP